MTNIIGQSDNIIHLIREVEKVAKSDLAVLIFGESGTGKELVARQIHESSKRRRMPLITVNCGAIPEGLVESELLGHEKGSFTNANKLQTGKFELANHGTIFLDEVAEMKPQMQVKLLRVLQEKKFTRLGGTGLIDADFRVVAATNKDIKTALANGELREDLYYRLAQYTIETPALRYHLKDVPLLAEHFLRKASLQNDSNTCLPKINEMTVSRLMQYEWPGNVRELENLINAAYIGDDVNTEIIRLLDKRMSYRTSVNVADDNVDACHIIIDYIIDNVSLCRYNKKAIINLGKQCGIFGDNRLKGGIDEIGRNVLRALKKRPSEFKGLKKKHIETVFDIFMENKTFARENSNSVAEIVNAWNNGTKSKSKQPDSILLSPSKKPEVFRTRISASRRLANLFFDESKKLILVEAPFGWGKDVLMREALIYAGSPQHRTIDISGIEDPRNLIENLVNLRKMEDEDLLEVDNDFVNAISLIRDQFALEYGNHNKCLLFFLNSNLNNNNTVPLPVWNAILALAESGFRCVIELWDDSGLRFGRSLVPNLNVGLFCASQIPRLDQTEVQEWLSFRSVQNTHVRDVFYSLGGHPLHIRVALDEIEKARSKNIDISKEFVSYAATKWLSGGNSDFKIYENHIEERLGKDLDMFLVQWAAFIQKHPFPLEIVDQKGRYQCINLVQMGLAYQENNNIFPLAWFRYYCHCRLLRENSSSFVLTRHHLSHLDGASREQISRDLFNKAVEFDGHFKKQMYLTAREVLSSINQGSKEDQFGDSPALVAISNKACFNMASEVCPCNNESDVSFAIFEMEQFCRNGMYEMANNRLKSILDVNDQIVLSVINSDWRLLRAFSRVLHVMRKRGVIKIPYLERLAQLIQSVNLERLGHSYHALNLCIGIGLALCRNDRKDLAKKLIDHIRHLLQYLPPVDQSDSRYLNRCGVRYRERMLSHMLADDLIDSRNAWIDAFELAQEVLVKYPYISKWQHRFLSCVAQIENISTSDHDILIKSNPDKFIENMADSETFKNHVLMWDWFREASQRSLSSGILKRLIKEQVIKTWKRVSKDDFDSIFNNNHFPIICGVILGDKRAIDWSCALIYRAIQEEAEPLSVIEREKHVEIFIALLHAANRYSKGISIGNTSWKTLQKFLLDPSSSQREIINGIKPRTLQAYIAGMMRAIINDYLNCNDETEDLGLELSIDPTKVIHEFARLALKNEGVNLPQIFRLHLWFEIEKSQRKLLMARQEKAQKLSYDDNCYEVIKMYEGRLSDTFYYKMQSARVERYAWNHINALSLAEEGYSRSTWFYDKKFALVFILDKSLVPAVFTPEALDSDYVMSSGEIYKQKLMAYGSQYVHLFSDELWGKVFIDSLNNSNYPAFWDGILLDIEKVLPSNECYWVESIEAEYNDFDQGFIKESRNLMNERAFVRMAAYPLRWASDIEHLPPDLRFRLAETAVRCSLASMGWLVRVGKGGDVSAAFGLACSILLAWKNARRVQQSEFVRILGRIDAPPMLSVEEELTWPEAAFQIFERLVDQHNTLGKFNQHIGVIYEKSVKPLYNYYTTDNKFTKCA